MAELDILPVTEVEPDAVLAAINEGFGQRRTREWYSWKHLEGPWGPSRGWVALDRGEVVGTRLFVPWRLRSGAGEHACSRAMDGATVPRARRRGVFSALIRAEMEALQRDCVWHAVYSTSVPASREAYRKLGWTILPETGMRARVTRARSSRRVQPRSELPDSLPTEVAGRLRTAWSAAALRWRTDPRSGHDYAVSVSRHDPDGALLVYRLDRSHRLPVLVPVYVAGADATARGLVDATAVARGCPVVLEPAGPGALETATSRLSRRGSGTTVSLWHNGGAVNAPSVDPAALESWLFQQADLEGVL